jgi:hypothetical protein
MILTTVARSVNAVSFKNANLDNIWAVFGQPTAWTSPYSDSSPPVPSIGQTAPTNPFCAVKATALLLLQVDSGGAYSFATNEGTIQFNSDDSDSDFITNGGTVVLPTATVAGELLYGLENQYRQVSFVTGLVPQSGYGSDTFLAAANISSYGNLILVQNYVPVPIISENEYVINGLLQF